MPNKNLNDLIYMNNIIVINEISSLNYHIHNIEILNPEKFCRKEELFIFCWNLILKRGDRKIQIDK